ncbi:UPF0158 family protein [Acidaminobacter hydrogenoformans]|uniref:Uncharacterized protein family (UPF0158) n=1 Tax=Acidaminobacter hydrogenoformans DSM 2784 TaxID=1120920 RepID=A0A1G5RZY2_9FIRM|nr:UPF0158 family protein [Acidaminobacter hydrogenoformans]SCZ79684.1 Uncharacterised protein family (UPF0158) [Acidaminobacter hydrogenoformans DSM 2784]
MKVDIEALASELEMSFDELDRYLDMETGEVIMVSDVEKRLADQIVKAKEGPSNTSEKVKDLSSFSEYEREAIQFAINIVGNPVRYKLLPKMTSTEKYDMMETFCHQVKSGQAREALLSAIQGKGAFGRFRETLLRLEIEQEWFAYQSAETVKFAVQWCEKNKVPYE